MSAPPTDSRGSVNEVPPSVCRPVAPTGAATSPPSGLALPALPALPAVNVAQVVSAPRAGTRAEGTEPCHAPASVEEEVSALASSYAGPESPRRLVERFVDAVNHIERPLWGRGSPDLMEKLFSDAEARAGREFWDVLSRHEVDFRLVFARARNWMAAMIKEKRRTAVRPVLRVLARVPMAEAQYVQTKFPSIVRVLTKLDDVVAREALAFAEGKTGSAGSGSAVASAVKPSRAEPSKLDGVLHASLFGNKSITSQLGTHKRVRSDVAQVAAPQAPGTSASASAARSGTPAAPAVPAKKRKIKRVHWKPDHELVAVRFIENTAERAGLRSAKGAKDVTEHEAERTRRPESTIPWREPLAIAIDDAVYPLNLRRVSSSTRGGLVPPTSAEAQAQQQRERDSPPAPNSAADPREPTPQTEAPPPGTVERQPVQMRPFDAAVPRQQGPAPAPAPVQVAMPGVPAPVMPWPGVMFPGFMMPMMGMPLPGKPS